MTRYKQILAGSGAFLAAAVIAACGGGGGGGAINPGGGGGNPSPSPAASPSPAGLTGALQIANGGNAGPPATFTYTTAPNAAVVFSCGCSSQAGTGTADASGNFTLSAVSTPTPGVPNPTYTIVPTRNYVIVGTTTAGEAWNFEFAGSVPSHDLALTGSGPSDVYSAAATLYVYRNSPPGSIAFDAWNFNSVLAWLTTLKTTPNTAEKNLLNDIAAQSALHRTLFPVAPPWNPSQASNATIAADLTAVTGSADTTKPTPCPGGAGTCTGTPTP